MVSEMITAVAGASKMFLGGVCSYTEQAKQKLLGVKKQTLDEFTVYVSVRDAHFEIVRDICIYKLCADPDRDTVRRLSAQTALEMVLELCAKSAG